MSPGCQTIHPQGPPRKPERTFALWVHPSLFTILVRVAECPGGGILQREGQDSEEEVSCVPKMWKSRCLCPRKNVTQTQEAALFVTAPKQKQPQQSSANDGQIKCSTLILQCSVIQPQKGMSTDSC